MSTPLTAAPTPQQAYESALTAAGYGADARARYIEAAADPEYAECVWDEEIIPAAEAASLIPESPRYEPTTAERVSSCCFDFAAHRYMEAHGGLEPWDFTPQDDAMIKAEAERLVADRGEELGALLAGVRPGEEWRDKGCRARVLALLAQEP